MDSVYPLLSSGGSTKFSKREGLDRTSFFRGGVSRKEGVTFSGGSCNFHIKNELKFDGKKSL